MSNYIYLGPFKEDIKNFLIYKENKEQDLKTIACYLHQFDEYTLNFKCNQLTREIIENWLKLKENENPNTRRLRAWSIKSFAKYLNLMGKEAFVIDSKPYQYKTTYIPYVFTDTDIKNFFKQIELTTKNSVCFPNNIQQCKLFFKILYCCGLRDSEALNLKYKDIDLKNKSILIKESKNNISRLIYINDELYDDLKIYTKKYSNKELDSYLFKNIVSKNKRGLGAIYDVFHSIIKNAGFDLNIHYRIHDLRHTFAVKNIKQVYEKGEDVYAFLPILMAYMGHSNIRSTEYYLRFTPDIYEKFTRQVEDYFGSIVPKLNEGNFYE